MAWYTIARKTTHRFVSGIMFEWEPGQVTQNLAQLQNQDPSNGPAWAIEVSGAWTPEAQNNYILGIEVDDGFAPIGEVVDADAVDLTRRLYDLWVSTGVSHCARKRIV